MRVYLTLPISLSLTLYSLRCPTGGMARAVEPPLLPIQSFLSCLFRFLSLQLFFHTCILSIHSRDIPINNFNSADKHFLYNPLNITKWSWCFPSLIPMPHKSHCLYRHSQASNDHWTLPVKAACLLVARNFKRMMMMT